VTAASAEFPGDRWNESFVFGGSLTISLGQLPAGQRRLGAGLDGWYQLQWYTQRSGTYDGNFVMWAEEHPSPSYGPAVHIWKVHGDWHSSLGARYGVTWPLRVGLGGGWWPGPGATAELGVSISTSGRAGLDASAALDGPWLQTRIGTFLTPRGLAGSRVHMGAFIPIRQPVGLPEPVREYWREPE